jgi:hypothetical protein
MLLVSIGNAERASQMPRGKNTPNRLDRPLLAPICRSTDCGRENHANDQSAVLDQSNAMPVE